MNLKAETEQTLISLTTGLPKTDGAMSTSLEVQEATTRLLKLFRNTALECVPPEVTKTVPNYPNREKLLGYKEGRNKTVKAFRTKITEATE